MGESPAPPDIALTERRDQLIQRHRQNSKSVSGEPQDIVTLSRSYQMDRPSEIVPRSEPRLRLQTLGSDTLRDSWRVEPVLRGGKGVALLAYLAAHAPAMVSRTRIAALIWGDKTSSAGRRSLSQMQWWLTRKTGHALVEGDEDRVGLAEPLWTDYEHFQHHLKVGTHESAIELYHGEFLPDLRFPGGAEFEMWAAVERNRFTSLYLQTVEVVTEEQLRKGRPDAAVAVGRRARDLHPWSEAAWRVYLSALLGSGDIFRARSEAGAFQEHLATEEQEPSEPTRDLLARIAGHSAAGPAPEEFRPDFVGRQAEFAEVLAAWDRAGDSGKMQRIVIEGRPGFGKTRLAQELIARLTSVQTAMVPVAARRADTAIDLSVAASLAHRLTVHPGALAIAPQSADILVRLDPRLGNTYPRARAPNRRGTSEREITLALEDLLGAVEHEQPVAIVLDDAHWCDRASRRVIDALMNNPGRRLWLVLGRPNGRHIDLGPATAVFQLAPLTEDMVSLLISSTGSLPDARWAVEFPHRLQRATGGSPLLVVETVKALLDAETLTLNAAGWHCSQPAKLEQTIQSDRVYDARLNALNESQVLALAVIGLWDDAPPRDLLREHGWTDEFFTSMESSGLVTRHASNITLSHDTLADVILARISRMQRGRAHEIIAELLCTRRTFRNLIRATRHLAEAGRLDRAMRIFTQAVLLRRSEGDRTSAATLASEIDQSLTPDAERLRPRLGRLLRFRLSPWSKPAVALLAGLLVTGATIAAYRHRPARPHDAAWLVQMPDHDGQGAGQLISSQWFYQPVSEFRSRIKVPTLASRHSATLSTVATDSGHVWAFVAFGDSSGSWDVYVQSGSHAPRRLSHWSGEDTNPSLSPDARRVVYRTTEGRSDGYNLAVTDVATATPQLIRNDVAESYLPPLWSPSAAVIAAMRTGPNGVEVCWFAPDGTGETCVPADSAETIVGWKTPQELVTAVPGTHLVVHNLRFGTTDTVGAAQEGSTYTLSPHGRFLLDRRAPRGEEPTWWVAPFDEGFSATQIHTDGPLRWVAAQPSPHVLESVEVDSSATRVPIGVPHRLGAVGRLRGGKTSPESMRWSLGGGLQSFVDGWTVAPGAGPFPAEVGVPGWLSTSVTIRGYQPTRDDLLTDDWSKGLEPSWNVLGDPIPAVRTTKTRSVLRMNGDENHTNAVYSKRTFDSREGLGLAVRVRVPVTREHYQDLGIWLLPVGPTSDQGPRDGEVDIAKSQGCGMRYPGVGPGPRNATDRLLVGDGYADVVPVFPHLAEGNLHEFLVQWFPDGTCGVAIDRQQIFRSRVSRPHRDDARILIQGRSLDTDIEVEYLELWGGIDTIVKWTIPSAQVAQR